MWIFSLVFGYDGDISPDDILVLMRFLPYVLFLGLSILSYCLASGFGSCVLYAEGLSLVLFIRVSRSSLAYALGFVICVYLEVCGLISWLQARG